MKKVSAEMVTDLLKKANEWNRIQKWRGAKRREDREDRVRGRAEEDVRILLRPVVRRMKEVFRRAMIPQGVTCPVTLSWPAYSDESICFDHDGVHISLAWTIYVADMTLRGYFHATCLEDCQAEGWTMWGVVEAMLRARITCWSADVVRRLEALASKEE